MVLVTVGYDDRLELQGIETQIHHPGSRAPTCINKVAPIDGETRHVTPWLRHCVSGSQ